MKLGVLVRGFLAASLARLPQTSFAALRARRFAASSSALLPTPGTSPGPRGADAPLARPPQIQKFAAVVLATASVAGCAALIEPADGLPDVGDNPRALPDGAEAKTGACDIDEMRERVCGSITAPVDVAADAPFWDCPADPKRLTSAGPTMLFYTDAKKLEFDRLMTLRYREELNANCGTEGERTGACCFSRCTPLPVAATASPGVPDGYAGYREKVQCVDAPQGGTRYPAAGAPECPAALVFGVGPRPFEPDPFDAAATSSLRARTAEFFADTPRCCYRTLEEMR